MTGLPPLPDPFATQRGKLFAWVPVCLGIGIGLYFSLAQEPGRGLVGLLGIAVLLGGGLAWRGPEQVQPAAMALALVAAGMLSGVARSQILAAPVLGFRYYGPVEGRILLVDRAISGKLRLTLDQVVLARMDPAKTPSRVRIAIEEAQPGLQTDPGLRVMTTAFLSEPPAPSEPGGFDFQRMAYFMQIGAIGYTRVPVLVAAPADPGWGVLFFNRLRQTISVSVRAQIAGDAGGFSAAILTNDISGISQARLNSLRISNLAHALSISGLHMALVTGFVFSMFRYGIALIPPLALRVSSKKVAAAIGLAAATFYLALSGAAVATERSYLMMVVILVAVLLERRAFSMRSVAMSATILLVVQPESLIDPGFQMSYAATVGLIAAFEALSGLRGKLWHPPRWIATGATLVMSSFVAGAATAPFGAAHFDRMSSYGLLANVLAEPLMAFVVMPAAVISAILAPFGLEAPALWAMGAASQGILLISDWVAAMPGAVVPVVQPSAVVLPMLTLGLIWLILWQGWLRAAGGLVAVAAMVLWSLSARPDLLVADTGGLAGLMTPDGRALSKGTGDTFAARAWLQDDGEFVAQPEAAARAGFSGAKGNQRFNVGAISAALLSGKGAAAEVATTCRKVRLVILAVEVTAPAPAGCLVLDQRLLRRTGALAIRVQGADLSFRATAAAQGARPWTPAGRRHRDGAPDWPEIAMPAPVPQSVAPLDAGSAGAGRQQVAVPSPVGRVAVVQVAPVEPCGLGRRLSSCGSNQPDAPAP